MLKIRVYGEHLTLSLPNLYLKVRQISRLLYYSSIVFILKIYGGSIADKELKNFCKYLDLFPMYSRIMFDKGFNLSDECAQRFNYYTSPPDRRGAAQMTHSKVRRKKHIANF